MFEYLKKIFEVPSLKRKFLFTLIGVLVFRLMAQITVPGANIEALKAVFTQNQALGVFSALMGGSMENFSIILMGLSPYINASIIVQLLSVVIPQLEALSKEGTLGKQKMQRYTRWLTIPLAFLQSYGMILLLNQLAGGVNTIVDASNVSIVLPMMLTITAGTVFLMWLGEIMTEKGIGNGVSILIFAGIIASTPSLVGQLLSLTSVDSSKTIGIIILATVTILLTAFVVWFTEAQRLIPLTYAKGTGGQVSHLPIKINQAGMIPIIFAVSLVTFPGLLANLFVNARSETLRNISAFITEHFSSQNPTLIYVVLYFLLVVFFSYFYVSITFKTDELAESLQKRSAFIPGVRPGNETSDYLKRVSGILNFYGGVFLGFVAIFPYLFNYVLSQTGQGSVPLLISGAGLIIIVGVVLEIARRVKVELLTHDYNKFY